MPSPFPGMNPYLEQEDVWHDFHERFCPACADWLMPQIRPKYVARIDESVYLHELPAGERRPIGRPDVTIAHARRNELATGVAVVEAPAVGWLPVAVDEERLSYLEIRDRATRRVVTAIELLSPSNKATGPNREQYLLKRRRLLLSDAHLVEIDLLRGGLRPPIEALPPCDYVVMVSRAEARPQVELWPLRLTDPLPMLPIPLLAGDADARLDLKALLDRIHDAAGYEDDIYQGVPVPPLSAEQNVWAQPFIPRRSDNPA